MQPPWPTARKVQRNSDEFGLTQIIEIGPMSGKSNVRHWLEEHNIPVTDKLVDKIFKEAKRASTVLSDVEIMKLVGKSQSA